MRSNTQLVIGDPQSLWVNRKLLGVLLVLIISLPPTIIALRAGTVSLQCQRSFETTRCTLQDSWLWGKVPTLARTVDPLLSARLDQKVSRSRSGSRTDYQVSLITGRREFIFLPYGSVLTQSQYFTDQINGFLKSSAPQLSLSYSRMESFSRDWLIWSGFGLFFLVLTVIVSLFPNPRNVALLTAEYEVYRFDKTRQRLSYEANSLQSIALAKSIRQADHPLRSIRDVQPGSEWVQLQLNTGQPLYILAKDPAQAQQLAGLIKAFLVEKP